MYKQTFSLQGKQMDFSFSKLRNQVALMRSKYLGSHPCKSPPIHSQDRYNAKKSSGGRFSC